MIFIDVERELFDTDDYGGILIANRDYLDEQVILFIVEGEKDYYYTIDDNGVQKLQFPSTEGDYWFTLVREIYPDYDIIHAFKYFHELDINV